MKFPFTGILMGAFLLAACGDEPADVGADTTGSVSQSAPAVTTTSTPPTPTTIAITNSTLDPGSLEGRLEAAGAVLGLDIPGGAWMDAGFDICERAMDSNVLMTVADDLVSDDQPAAPDTTLLAARILWSNLELICPEALTDEFLQAGPPVAYEFPRCEALIPVGLPWSEEVGEPTDRDILDGVVVRWWRGQIYHTGLEGGEVAQEMTTLVGRGRIFQRIVEANQLFGEIQGNPLYVSGYDDTDTSSVELAWSSSRRWCDATVIRLNPDPLNTPVAGTAPITDLAAYVESLIFPVFVPSPTARLDEIIFSAAEAIEGGTHLGGEPSHGGAAVTTFQLADDLYGVRGFLPEMETHRLELGEPTGQVLVGGVEVALYQAEGSLIGFFERAGLSISVGSSTASEAELLDALRRLIDAVDLVTE